MRPIKFRAYIANQGMFPWEQIQMSFEGFQIVFDKGKVHYPNGELMQFTGLLDKNGKEIYEGDIVGSTGHTGAIDNSVIEFGSHNIGNDLGYYRKSIKNGEKYTDWGMAWHYDVIGNIYENSELIK